MLANSANILKGSQELFSVADEADNVDRQNSFAKCKLWWLKNEGTN